MNKTLCISFILCSLTLMACGKNENAAEDALKVQQKGDQFSYEASGNDGQKVTITANGKGVDLPGDFPKDIPIIKNGIVRAAMSEGKQLLVQIAWKGQISEAMKLYETEMKGHGWSIESRFSTAEMSMISASKAGRQTTITASIEEGATILIQLVILEGE